MNRPETQYVAVGDADIAYQVIGDGPVDLLYCYGLGSHLEHFWDMAPAATASPGEILVSSTTKDLMVRSELEFAAREKHELKGVPGSWRLFAVAN